MSLAHNPRFKALGSVVATAAIPAVVLGSLATPAQAAPIAPARDALTPKIATPSMVKAAEARIAAHLVAAHVPTTLTPATAKKTGTETVRENDTLSHIKVRTGVSVADLKRFNGLSSDHIVPGQVLKLSGAAAAPVKSGNTAKAPAKAVATRSYKIQFGDTVKSIATKLGVEVSEVRRAAGNPVNDFIFAGRTLRIGSGAASTSNVAAKPSTGSRATTSSTHTVREGENPSVIASRYGMKLSAFMSLNSLQSGSIIRPGQVLKTSGTASAAQSSKSAASAAKTPAAKAPVAKAPAARQSTYTIVDGDTLIGIGIKTGTAVNTLLKLNNLSYSSTLRIGKTLKTSGTAAPSSTSKSTVNPSSSKPLVGNTFLGRTYSSGTVSSANANKQALLSTKQPSRAQMQSMVSRTAAQMGVEPSLALAHAFQESSFDMASVSPANAVGVMQVIPSAGQWAETLVGRKLNLLDPQDNVTAGVAIIRHHQRNSSSKEIGIAAYYQGASGVKKYGMYPDTKRYVANITALQNRF
ncbi:lytic transglycosylase [Arthrobacter sp. MYb227]|uniref:lytic transglycosylase domain-containing protein n=1 Tax=Arthrobacter sp. MYb227 TaxID=1848601 RepID=UPI000CFAA9D1|nr:lytic transglycosylase domain-containing protein [Arthrobacter sp. MYb227]PQZ95887.1 lytic transglycosylase [Arthrobacter sp. MYb227]